MGTDSLYKNCYVVVTHNNYEPYGAMVASYSTEQEALDHIKYQREHMGNTSHWNILHIKDMEWLNPEIGIYKPSNN